MSNKAENVDIKEKNVPHDVPYIVYEGAMARAERNTKRLWIALLVSLFMLAITNGAWLIYESQYETYTYSQDGEGFNNLNTGSQGDVLYGAETENSEKEKGES